MKEKKLPNNMDVKNSNHPSSNVYYVKDDDDFVIAYIDNEKDDPIITINGSENIITPK